MGNFSYEVSGGRYPVRHGETAHPGQGHSDNLCKDREESDEIQRMKSPYSLFPAFPLTRLEYITINADTHLRTHDGLPCIKDYSPRARIHQGFALLPSAFSPSTFSRQIYFQSLSFSEIYGKRPSTLPFSPQALGKFLRALSDTGVRQGS